MLTRHRLPLLLPLFLLLLVPVGCSDDDDECPTCPEAPATGSIFVTVRSPGGYQVVAGASVFTHPPALEVTTGALGTALLEELEARTYVVIATHPEIGSGNAAVTVAGGQVQNVAIELVAGAFLQPLVEIMTPQSGQVFSYVDSITVRAAVSDDEDAPASLALVLSSDLDGELSTASANEDGIVEVQLTGLSLGDHELVLAATDNEELTGTATVTVSVQSFAPAIEFLSPEADAGYAPGDTVHFAANVHDPETPAAQLEVEWRSDLDGVLNVDAPDAQGHLAFSTGELSRGVHAITLAVTDTDGNTAADSVTIRTDLPPAVVLAPLVKDAGGIELTWTPVEEPDFASYRIYRATDAEGAFELIQILNDAMADRYRDTEVGFGQQYWYRVGLRTIAGNESTSNTESIEAGIAIEVLTQVEAMLVDPARPYLYAIDRINNSLLFVSLDDYAVTRTIFVGSSPTDLAIDDTGAELFIANFGSNQIAVVDLTTQEVVRNLSVDVGGGWGGNPYRLGCVENGRLAWVSEDQWVDLRLVRQSDGGTLDVAGSIYQPDLEVSPDGASIYLGESGISRSLIVRYRVVGDVLQQVDSYDFGSYTSRSVVLSGSGQYVFYGRHKLLASNLSTDLGTLPDIIWETNHDGSIAFGEGDIYDAETFSIIRAMPVATHIMALGPLDQVLYLYDDASAKIFLFDVASLTGN